MLEVFKIQEYAEEVIRYNGNIFYEYKGVIYKKPIDGSDSNYQVVSSLKSVC